MPMVFETSNIFVILTDGAIGNCRATIIKKTEHSVLPFPGILYANPFSPPDLRLVMRILNEIEPVPGQV